MDDTQHAAGWLPHLPFQFDRKTVASHQDSVAFLNSGGARRLPTCFMELQPMNKDRYLDVNPVSTPMTAREGASFRRASRRAEEQRKASWLWRWLVALGLQRKSK